MAAAMWLLVVCVALLAVGAGVYAAYVWRARRRLPQKPVPLKPKRPRYPVVLAHGMFGFDALELGKLRRDYFHGVRDRLIAAGAEVVTPRVPKVASVARRAEALAFAVRQLDAKRVNIIAHSMGGLDARYAISRLGLAAKVASLTTIGTPHTGTPLADPLQVAGLSKLLEKLGAAGLCDVSTVRMAAFNREIADQKGVDYACVLASVKQAQQVHPLLLPAYLFLSERCGPNDGLVPADSQKWGEVLDQVDADHWAQIGWRAGFDAGELYARVVEELARRGH